MWPFSKKVTKERLRQYKTIKISGMKFVIRKLNPLFDFSLDKMPQIFSSHMSNRKVDETKPVNEATLKRNQEDMKNVIVAGLIDPDLTDKVSIEDIMGDSGLALKLYTEIIIHSLNMFKGVKGLFFSIKLRRAFSIEYQKSMEKAQTK